MATTTRIVDTHGHLVGPGEYSIIDTRVHVTSVTRPNGLTIDQQDATIVHTVTPAKPAPEPTSEPTSESTDEPAAEAVSDGKEQRLYCGRCNSYTDHVSTAHDGLAARGLLRSDGK